MIYQIEDRTPEIDDSCFVAESADVIGSVIMRKNSSVWFNCVLRGDADEINIGENSNVQDGSVLHADEGQPLHIGKDVTVGHKVMLHGCSIGDGSLIGMNAVILNGAQIGKGCLIGANTLITENKKIPDGAMVCGSPGKVIKQLDEKSQKLLLSGAKHYVENAKTFSHQLKKIDR